MAIEVREQKGKKKVYRRSYDQALKRPKSVYVGSLPIGAAEVPDELCALLTADEIGQLRIKLGLTAAADTITVAASEDGYGIEKTIAALAAFAEAAPTMLASDRDRLTIAARSMVAAFRRIGVITIGNVNYVERVGGGPLGGQLTIIDGDDDPFAIPVPPRKAEPDEQVYRTGDNGRITVKTVLAEVSGGLPVPSDFIRAKVGERYPEIDVDGLVSDWHDSIRDKAGRYEGKTQGDADEDFILAVPRIVADRLRAKLPSGTRVADFKDEAERISWEDGIQVTAEQLWRYAKRLEGFGGDRRTPVSDDLLTDIRAFLGL